MKHLKVNEGSLARAVAIAVDAHAGQYDKTGADYIEHPLRVMSAGKNVVKSVG